MTRDWKTGKQIENAHYCWEDLILEDTFGITEKDWNTVVQDTIAHIGSWTAQTITERVNCMVDLLLPPLQTLWQGKDSSHPFRWLPCRSLPGATVADHSLTASAIAYCLAYDEEPRPDIETLDYLRLSALTATWKDDDELGAVYDTLWAGHKPIEPNKDGNNHERIVFLSKTAASERICPDKVEFNKYPLKDEKQQIGLVLGGATKIKGYFMESAKLPEIRGASALLDRINLEDVPALFGRKATQDKQRYNQIRESFNQRTGHKLTAPECIIYAAGGNTLAFTPASVVHYIADEIECIYTKETLVANSVAVGDTFDLLELQYGLNPTRFWVEDFRKACEDSEISELMQNYYGSKDDNDFFKRKCFGELTSKLAQAQLHRREGNPTQGRKTQRDLPRHIEIGPYQQRCESCDRRPAIINLPHPRCEACTRKHVVGRVTKKESDLPADQRSIEYYLGELSDWKPATPDGQGSWCLEDWSSLFKKYLQATGKEKQYCASNQELGNIQGPQDLDTIANASAPKGYIAFIYADGNNMGGYLENIETPAEYRQFSERVFIALQKAAFDALAKHLTPTDKNIHPFEIISIGGDDLILIVPGSAAFDVVHAIGENFDRQFDSQKKYTAVTPNNLRKSQRYLPEEWAEEQCMQPAFSLSLGFVIADEHTPVAFLEHLAASLLKSAKSRAKTLIKDDVGYRGGTVDFLVLKSISMIASNLSDFRKNAYKTETDNSLTMRPYTLHELSGFIKTAKDLKKENFPNSQLYQLRESLKLGRATSTLDYLYFRSRLEQKHGDILKKYIEQNWHGVSNNNLGPWYQKLKAHEYETLLLDLIEAYEFIQKPDDNTEDNDID